MCGKQVLMLCQIMYHWGAWPPAARVTGSLATLDWLIFSRRRAGKRLPSYSRVVSYERDEKVSQLRQLFPLFDGREVRHTPGPSCERDCSCCYPWQFLTRGRNEKLLSMITAGRHVDGRSRMAEREEHLRSYHTERQTDGPSPAVSCHMLLT